MVQEQIKSNVLRIENKEFAFTKMMTLRLCESSICADEKFKKYKNGTITRYVYYCCTKARGTDCKCGYTEEKDVLKQFEELIEKIDINEIQIKEKIKADVEKFTNLQNFFLSEKEKVGIPNVDIRGYARYILREGGDIEKIELLGCLRSKFMLNNKNFSCPVTLLIKQFYYYTINVLILGISSLFLHYFGIMYEYTRILVIEDPIKLANSIKKGLENIDYAVVVLYDRLKELRRIEAILI